ncbi:MAG: hypothetical protein ABI743_11905, partial [bacterium]
EFPAATRVIGSWGLPERVDTFQALLRVGDFHDAGAVPFTFTNTDSTFTVTHDNCTVHFRTVRTLFADSDLFNADSDADGDGLTAIEEAALSSSGRSMGDPRERDVLVAVGFTHPDWAMSDDTRIKVTTAFFRGDRINLNIFTHDDPVLDITPGQIELGGTLPDRSHVLTIDEARQVHPQLVPNQLANLFHFCVFAEQLTDGVYGRAEQGGNDLTCRALLPVIGNPLDYQAKDFMHELGHNLGLCEAVANDGTGVCPEIPVAERATDVSVMGSPVEDAGHPVEILLAALNRPLNYTASMWQALTLSNFRLQDGS